MSVDLSLAHLIWQASPVVKLVMLILVGASIASWAVIFHKRRQLRAAAEGAEQFEERFWSGGSVAELYAQANRAGSFSGGLDPSFRAAFREFSRLPRRQVSPEAVVEAAQRARRVALTREADQLEAQVPFLATVGSTSPYIGL